MSLKYYVLLILLWVHFSLHLILEASLEFFCEIDTINDACCAIFCDIRSAMVSKHSELTKRQAQDRYGRFASLSSRTAPPPSRHEVGSSSCHRTTPPSRMQEVGSSSHCRTAPPPSSNSDDLVKMWVVAPPPLCLQVAPPPPLTHLVPPPPSTCVWECPHVKEVSSYEHCF
jgi:hypothetical protein